jgi:hypothetical protein
MGNKPTRRKSNNNMKGEMEMETLFYSYDKYPNDPIDEVKLLIINNINNIRLWIYSKK